MITKGIMLWSSNKFVFDLLDAIFNGADNKNYIGWPSIRGWWGEGVLIKKWNFPIQPATYIVVVVSYFKQMSRHLLELPKMQLPLFVCACKCLAIATGSIVSADVLWAVQLILHHRVPKVCFEASQSGNILLRCERLVFFFLMEVGHK